jgi:uncharacterized repeat protein (TIGR03803 family)
MNNHVSRGKRRYSAIASFALGLGTAIGVSMVLTIPAQAATETIVHNFTGSPDGGSGYSGVLSGLIQDAAGNLFGTTGEGGIYDAQNGGAGTVFELSLQNGVWVETVIHSFGGPGDGGFPYGGLVMDGAGNLYGVLFDYVHFGAVYKLTPDGHGNWTETILTEPGAGPQVPFDTLTLDAAGNIYGVGLGTGSEGKCRKKCGFVYELSPPASPAKKKWKYTVLYRFLGEKYGDGENPYGNLVFDAAGNLYGVTAGGGAADYGIVFELSPGVAGWTEKVIYDFSDGLLGQYPRAGLTRDPAGNLYGTTAGYGGGMVFELSPNNSWTLNVLYSFPEPIDGKSSWGLVTLRDGNLYGTTIAGGSSGDGVVFELSASGGTWTENVLHSFAGSPSDGVYPEGGLVFDNDGNLYGVTTRGGATGNGIVYEISQ